jgi:nicotinamide riboside transporter PnuC
MGREGRGKRERARSWMDVVVVLVLVMLAVGMVVIVIGDSVGGRWSCTCNEDHVALLVITAQLLFSKKTWYEMYGARQD